MKKTSYRDRRTEIGSVPAELTQKFERVETKSRAGVKYTKYRPYLVGNKPVGKNRATRRRELFAKPIKQHKFNNPVWNAKKDATKARVIRKQAKAHAKAVERKAKLSPKSK